MKFRVYKVISETDGETWYIQLRARNGRILMDAGGYNSKAHALRAVRSIRFGVVSAKLEVENASGK